MCSNSYIYVNLKKREKDAIDKNKNQMKNDREEKLVTHLSARK